MKHSSPQTKNNIDPEIEIKTDIESQLTDLLIVDETKVISQKPRTKKNTDTEIETETDTKKSPKCRGSKTEFQPIPKQNLKR